MGAISHEGDMLLITRGKYRGYVAQIKKVIHLPCGLIDYLMEIDDSDEDSINGLEFTIRSEDCREYTPGSINLEQPFDITNYLSTNKMKDIAEEIYKVKITEYVDAILNNRKELGCGNIVQQILNKVVNEYAENMFNQYKDELLEIFKKVINMDLPASNDEDEKCFARSIQWALENRATKYIENNQSEIEIIMKDKIHKRSKEFIDEKLSYTLSKSIEFAANKVIEDVFSSK